MPLTFCWDACVSSVFIINRLSTKVLANFQSPFETLFGSKPDYSFFKVFGCSCYPYLRPYNSHKFSFRSTKCLFLGYSPAHKGYRCLSPSGRTYIAKSVTFNENDFLYSTLFTRPNTSHQSFIHKFSCPSYVLPYCPPVYPPSTHLPTSSSQRHISSFANMSNTFTVVVTDTPMALTLSVSNALSDNACSSFSNSTIGSASLQFLLLTTWFPHLAHMLFSLLLLLCLSLSSTLLPIFILCRQCLKVASTNLRFTQLLLLCQITSKNPLVFDKLYNYLTGKRKWRLNILHLFTMVLGGWFLKLKECILSRTNESLNPS